MSQTSRTSLIYNLTGQAIEFYPPEAEIIAYGRPTSAAAYSAWRGDQSNDDVAVFTGTATLDSVSTTVDAASGASQSNRRRLSVAATTDIAVGRRYLVANVSGQREIVEPVLVASADYLDLENDLRYDYPITSSTLKGLRHSFTIDTTFIQTQANINAYSSLGSRRLEPAPPYRLRWRYTTADGIAREHWTYFDVVRQRGTHNVTAADLRELFPDILEKEWRGTRGQQFSDQINAAWDRFCFDLRCVDYPIDALREGPIVDELVRQCALMLIAETGLAPGNRDPREYAQAKTNDYERMFDRALGSALKAWIDTGTTGEITASPPRNSRLRK